MSGSANETSRVRRLLAESAVIIASILAAFAVDAWWEQIGEDEQARAFLEALVDDFEGARADLERVRYAHQVMANNMRILELITEAISLADDSTRVLDKAFGPSLANEGGKPRIGHA